MSGGILRGTRLLALATMQVALVTAILYALGAAGGGTQPARWPELAALMLAALAADRLLAKQPAGLRQAVRALAGAPLVLLLLKSMLGGGLAPGAGWDRLLDTRLRSAQELVFCALGLIVILRRAATLPALHGLDLANLFKRQVLILAGVLLCAPLLESDLTAPAAQATLGGYVLAFVAGALAAIVLGQLPPALGAAKQRRIAAGGLLPAALIIAAAAAMTSAVSPGMRGLVVAALGGLRNLLLVPIALLGLIAGAISRFFIALAPRRADLTPIPTPTPGPEGAALPPQMLEPLPPMPTPPWVTALSYSLTILLLLVGAWLALRWLKQREPAAEEPAGERESVWSWRQLGADLRGLAAGLGGGRRDEPNDDSSAAARRIRRAYRSFLLLAAERQRPRQEHQTPREFLPAANPLAEPASARLTELYEQARYGGELPPEAAAEAEAAARTLRSSGSRQ